jgi:hypothetical protein
MQQASWSILNRTSRGFALCLFLVALLFGLKGNSQTAGTANIQGVVTDQSGAVLPNAAVVITNGATQVKHTVTTNADGLYSFPNIAIGNYSIDISAPGFKHYGQSNIVLEVGSSIAVNVAMTVGSVNETVQVQATALALQTEDASFKQTIDGPTLTELPLNGRQVTSLITLSGGSVNVNPGVDVLGSKSFWSSVAIEIAGGQGNATDYRLDGGDNNDYMTNVNLPFPFPDAVAEFSVETTDLSAQSGLHPGGLVNVVTKSGTNQWHGDAFEFIRNNFIDATNFFSTTKDTLHQNQFGGTFGGRIIRNKLFGFAGYQRLKNDQSQSNTTAYVPTAANLLGDFSASDPTIQLLVPATGIPLVNNKYSDTPGVTWSPNASALALDKYLPPTTAANGLVTYAIPLQVAENQFVTRVDWTINAKQSLYGRYFLDGYQSPAFFSPTNVLITSQPGNSERVQAFTLGEIYIVSNNLVNSFHATVTRRLNDRGPAAPGINPATIGLNMYSVPSAVGGMRFTVTNKWNLYCGTCSTAYFNDATLSVADDVNWVHGKHQVAFGGDYVRSDLNISNAYEGNGYFTFSGIYGEKGPNGSSKGGTGVDANLDFLTGSLASMVQSNAQQNAIRGSIPSLYIQDTYHATRKIVLSAGVRWDPEYVPLDHFNRGSTFNMSDFLNNTASAVFPNAPPGMLFYGDQGVPRAFTQNTPLQFSPRVGATYDPLGTGKTVFRVGSALVYDTPNLFTAQHVNQNPPFSSVITNTPVGGPLNFTSPWTGGTTPYNPFPLPYPPLASTSATSFNGSQIFVLPPHFRQPYALQWTASVQQDLGHGWQLQLDYIGNKTTFNPYGLPLNPAVYIPGTCGGSPCSTIGNEASRFLLTVDNPVQGPKYPGGSSSDKLILTGANASYNGMITTLQHRISSSFVFMANYTWSHCIDIEENGGDEGSITVQNVNNIKGDKASCGYDHRDVFNTTLVASSHFRLTGLPAKIVNNWEIAPVVVAMDGAPLTVTSGVDNSLTNVGLDRPNFVNPGALYTHAKILSGPSVNAKYINSSAFAQNATGTFGDSGRNAYRGPKYLQTDMALSRFFPLHDSLKLDFRLEAFNLLNHPDFSAPSSASLTSSTFGEVTGTSYGARIFQGAIKLIF